ncbi:DUF5641 domain-containing protein [Nephila pilipes]|uniref:DUF5641 domain-containing protein n=1 Tax=Nephila pilipes TaxID=299642 RepID=A0A8X6PSD7_NEPPI|nr:DUF5641 domain-containing protein [Nephila pilipes]GFT82937.1 DUF5641 domain-containing protein [Nephila pilipes]GFU35069.1 DUF5641 domain-containing protein [Nephila pilipes]GFU42566.1 DUF5641 domain-containing protein [Nephila pilipes]
MQQITNKRIKYRLALQKDLGRRFRSEYLGSLVQRPKLQKWSTISVGDVVLIGNDNQKRINWSLGRVIEIIPGKEGITRFVRLRTVRGEMLRPIQWLFLLEITCQMTEDVKAKVAKRASGSCCQRVSYTNDKSCRSCFTDYKNTVWKNHQ